MLIFEQWWGSIIKIYCQFHLNRQVWQKSRQQAKVVAPTTARFAGASSILKLAVFCGCIAAYILVIGMWVGAFAYPRR
jgi:hypothetical protein